MERRALVILGLCFVSFCTKETEAGFLYGAPCSERNTAYLSPFQSRFPKETTTCLDITSMGTSTVIPFRKRLGNVSTVYADHMNLRDIPVHILEHVPMLELLDLSGNNITQIPKDVFVNLKQLKTLLLADNKVQIPRKVPLLKSDSLETLSLSNNGIKRLSPVAFKELPMLKVLYLDRNHLKRIGRKAFRHLKHLKYLHLGSNLLQRMPPTLALPRKKITLITKGNPFNNTRVVIK